MLQATNWWFRGANKQMTGAVKPIVKDARVERRSNYQPAERLIGRVVACDGGYATICASTTEVVEGSSEFWSIGQLISITVEGCRVVGLVYKMASVGGRWDDQQANTIQIQVELIGEIRESAKGDLGFSRGITSYPPLGALAHRIRSKDLVAVHLPYSKRSVVVGTLSQDESIPATVDIESLLTRHFAIVGTTGTGKSSALALLMRKVLEARPELRILLFDPHNEFSRAFPEKSNVITADTLELPFWVFQHEEFAEVLFRGRDGVE